MTEGKERKGTEMTPAQYVKIMEQSTIKEMSQSIFAFDIRQHQNELLRNIKGHKDPRVTTLREKVAELKVAKMRLQKIPEFSPEGKRLNALIVNGSNECERLLKDIRARPMDQSSRAGSRAGSRAESRAESRSVSRASSMASSNKASSVSRTCSHRSCRRRQSRSPEARLQSRQSSHKSREMSRPGSPYSIVTDVSGDSEESFELFSSIYQRHFSDRPNLYPGNVDREYFIKRDNLSDYRDAIARKMIIDRMIKKALLEREKEMKNKR